MSSGFLLLETVPGREGRVLEQLATVVGVTHHSVLFPAAIAVKIDSPSFEAIATDLQRLDGVLGARLYRARNT